MAARAIQELRLMLQDLVIFQKIYDFILWLFPVVNKFPKSQRFVLGQQIENIALEILKNVIQANSERGKAPLLKQASVNLDLLRIMIRLAKDLHFIGVKQYGFSADKVNEIGKLLGGMMRTFNK